MKFGKQLELHAQGEWRDKVVSYKRLKRLLKRLRFVMDEEEKIGNFETRRASKLDGDASAEKKFSKPEFTRPRCSNPLRGGAGRIKFSIQFFRAVHEDLRVVNEYFAAKCAELCLRVDELEQSLSSTTSNTAAATSSSSVVTPPPASALLAAVVDQQSPPSARRSGSFYSPKKSAVERRTSSSGGGGGDGDGGGTGEEGLHTESFHQLQASMVRRQSFHHRAFAHVSVLPDKGIRMIEKVYEDVLSLIDYVNINRDGFRKIVKKYDKTTGEHALEEFLKILNEAAYVTDPRPEDLKNRIQNLCSRDLLLLLQKQEKMRMEVRSSTADPFKAVKKGPLLLCLALALIVALLPLGHAGGGNATGPPTGAVSGTPTGIAPRAKRCLCMLVFIISMWVTEAIPYFATALLVPPLVVLLRLFPHPTIPNANLPPQQAASTVLNSMIDRVSILLLGGFALSAAFSRCQLELWMASKLQRRFGDRPYMFLLSIMLLGLFLSSWIGNTTAPVLVISVLLPVIHDFPAGSRYAKALLLGLAFSCNLGGMTTPISSPQNAISLQFMQQAQQVVTFGQWLQISVPFCTIGVIITWALLILLLNPSDATHIPVIVYKGETTRMHWVVLILSVLTVGGWATFHFTESIFGDLGIIAMLFIGFTCGSGILTQLDFNSFPWNLLFLMGGGHVLGEAIYQSGLLSEILAFIVPYFPVNSVWWLTMDLCLCIFALSSFVSHTVSAIVIMPIIVNLASRCAHPAIPIMCSTLAISGFLE